MDFEATVKRNNEKIARSKTFKLMSDFNDKVSLNPASEVIVDKTKEGRVKLIRAVVRKMIPYHDAFKSPVRDFGDSVLLMGGAKSASYMITEAIAFATCLNNFYGAQEKTDGLPGGVKTPGKAQIQVQELFTHYKQFQLTPKKIKDTLIVDLKMYGSEFGFNVDPRVVSQAFEDAGCFPESDN